MSSGPSGPMFSLSYERLLYSTGKTSTCRNALFWPPTPQDRLEDWSGHVTEISQDILGSWKDLAER